MVIQEKLNFLVENKDTEEVKYPHVYKLFHDLENYQEKKVFEIWMEKIAEPISVRIDYIKEYCDEEEKKEKGKRGKCDLMIALFTVYKKLKEKPYLCHCNTDSCFIKNNPFNNKPILEYEYYNYTSLHSLFWGYRSFPLDSNVDEENKRYKACLKQMFEVLDSSSNSFNSLNAIRNGFYDFDYTPVTEIQKSDLDCAYLERFISSIADKRRKKPELYIDESTISIVKENFHTEFWELENEFYILTEDIITNQGCSNKIDDTPRSILYKHICNDSYAYDYMENYINLMLTDEKQSKNIIKDKEFFLVEYASHLSCDILKTQSKYTNEQAKQLKLVLNHLEIINYYLDSYKQITSLVIKEAVSDKDKISCFITILKLISGLDPKRFIAVREKLKDVWRYNNLIDSIQTRSLLRDDVAIRNTDVLINEIIVCLETQKKSLEEYEKDRENLINEIIAEIISIINKTKKNDIIEKEEEKENILFNQEDKYNYDFITKELEPYISGGTPSVYKSIIEKKVLPKEAQKLRAKTIKKADIYRFSKCFDLTIPEINNIFEIEIKANNKPKEYVNDFFRVLKGLNPDFKAPKKQLT